MGLRMTVSVAVSMTQTEPGVMPPAMIATYALLPSGLKAIPAGVMPTAMVPVTVFVAVLMTEMLLSTLFATYALVPLGLKAMATGSFPTGKLLVVVLVTVLITEMVRTFPFPTYALLPTGLNATGLGAMPTAKVLVTVCACRGADRQPHMTARHPMLLKSELAVDTKDLSHFMAAWYAAEHSFVAFD